jgi:hypothetical protein
VGVTSLDFVVRLACWKSESQSSDCSEDVSVKIVGIDCALVQDSWSKCGVSDEPEICRGIDSDRSVGVGDWVGQRSLDVIS